MGGIPGVKRKPWYQRDTFAELFGTVPPILAALVSSIGIAMDSNKPQWMAYLAVGGMIWLILAAVHRIIRTRAKDRAAAELESPRDLVGCTHVLYALLCRHCQIAETDNLKLRITLHRVVPPASTNEDPTELEQVTPYVGGRGGEPGRRFSIKCGLIGLAAKNHAPYRMRWDGMNPQGFIDELTQTYNYTTAEAEHLVGHRRSWLAVPISGARQRETIGVLFLDSGDPGLMTDEVLELVLRCAFGVANYVKERYG